MANTLGDLVVNIVANTKKFDGDIDKAKKSVTKFEKDLKTFGTNANKYATLPILAIGAGLVKLTKNIGDNADKLLDLEQITGLSTTTLQEFQNVATVAGVSFEGLTGIVQKFSSRLPTIEAGTSESAKAFKQLNVDLKDANGEIRSSEELVPELITSLQGIQNVTERNAIAQQVFGRSLGDLAPVLGLTAEETQKARDEARELGLVWDREAIVKANEFRIQTEQLTNQFKQQGVELASSLIPVFQDLIPTLSATVSKVADGIKSFTDLDDSTKKLIFGIAGVTAGIGPAIKAVTALKIAFTALTGPVGIALTAVTGLVAGIKTLQALDAKKQEETFGEIAEKTGVAATDLKTISDISLGLISRADTIGQGFAVAAKNTELTAQELAEVLLLSENLTEDQRNYLTDLQQRFNTSVAVFKANEENNEKEIEQVEEKIIKEKELSEEQIKRYVDQNERVQDVLDSAKSEIELIDERIASITELALKDSEFKDDQTKAVEILQARKKELLDEEKQQRIDSYNERVAKENENANEVYALEKELADKKQKLREEEAQEIQDGIDTVKRATETLIGFTEQSATEAVGTVADLTAEIGKNSGNLYLQIGGEIVSLATDIINAFENAAQQTEQITEDLANTTASILEDNQRDWLERERDNRVKAAQDLADSELEIYLSGLTEQEQARLKTDGIIEESTTERLKREIEAAREAGEETEALQLENELGIAEIRQTALDEAEAAEKDYKNAIAQLNYDQAVAQKELQLATIKADRAQAVASLWWNPGERDRVKTAYSEASSAISAIEIPPPVQFATGGVVTQPTYAMVGEQRGEVMFGMGASGAPMFQEFIDRVVAGLQGQKSAGQTTININSMYPPRRQDLDKLARDLYSSNIKEQQRRGI